MERRKVSPMFIASMAIAVGSTLLYHLFQKATPGTVNPAVALGVTYLASALICAALLPLFPPEGGLMAALRQLNWASLALAAAVVGIELGFLLAYRAGWEVGIGGLVANIGATLLLVPLGALLFGERLSLTQLAGGALCIAGLFLINRR